MGNWAWYWPGPDAPYEAWCEHYHPHNQQESSGRLKYSWSVLTDPTLKKCYSQWLVQALSSQWLSCAPSLRLEILEMRRILPIGQMECTWLRKSILRPQERQDQHLFPEPRHDLQKYCKIPFWWEAAVPWLHYLYLCISKTVIKGVFLCTVYQVPQCLDLAQL